MTVPRQRIEPYNFPVVKDWSQFTQIERNKWIADFEQTVYERFDQFPNPVWKGQHK